MAISIEKCQDESKEISTSVLAIIALVLSFIPLMQIPAVFVGIVAIVQINRSNGRQKGKGFAVAGIIISSVLMIVVAVVALVAGSSFFYFKGVIEPSIEQSIERAMLDANNTDGNLTAMVETKAKAEPKAEPKVEQKDHSDAPVPIVGEDENIIVNPAGSGGTRYLLVEIFLLRADEQDVGFKPAIEAKSKELQDVTINTLRRYNAEDLSNPVNKDTIKDRLKVLYQAIIGADHPIEKLLVTKWIMQ